MSSSPSRPTRCRSLDRDTVVTLSTMRLLGSSSPLTESGSTGSRIMGASVGSVVKAQTVTDAVASNRSSWMITTGRGFPA
jgi:hypothetical protein